MVGEPSPINARPLNIDGTYWIERVNLAWLCEAVVFGFELFSSPGALTPHCCSVRPFRRHSPPTLPSIACTSRCCFNLAVGKLDAPYSIFSMQSLWKHISSLYFASMADHDELEQHMHRGCCKSLCFHGQRKLRKGKLKWRKESGLQYSSRCTRHTFKFHTLVDVLNQKCSLQRIKQTVS